MSDDRTASRRDFLGAVVPHRAAESAAPSPEAQAPQGVFHVHVSRRAMACLWEVIFNAGQQSGDTEAAVAALDLVEQLEAQLTVYRETSEVMRLNRAAPHGWVTVESRLFDLLALAREVHDATGGAYDISSGALIDLWSLARREGRLPSEEEQTAALAVSGSQQVELERATRAVRFTQPGVKLNLGSIGKGYALDRCAEILFNHGVDNYLCQGGRSSVLARGDDGATPGGGWAVGIGDPLRPGERLSTIRLSNQALSTSGAGTQFYRYQGRRYGHLLDPRTGWPANGVLSTTVLASSAALAEALSTACYVLGPEGTERYCAAHPEIAVVMTLPGGGLRGLSVRTWNFEPGQLAPL